MEYKLIILESFIALCSIVSLYIAVVLTWFQYQPRNPPVVATGYPIENGEKPARNGARNLGRITNGNGHGNGVNGNRPPYGGQRVNGPLSESPIPVITNHAVALQRICLTSSWLTLIRCLLEHAVLYLALTGIFSSIACDIVIRVHIVLYLLPVTLQYAFLWLRQRVLQLNPLLRNSSCSCSTCISWMSLIFLFVCQVTSTSLFMVNESFERRNESSNASAQCVSVPTGILAPELSWIISTSLYVCFMICFLSIFVQPLLCRADKINFIAMSQNRNPAGIFPRIKRLLMASGTSVVTDLLAIIGCTLANDLFISLVVLDANLVINQLCAIFSYKSWRSRICPICSGRSLSRESFTLNSQRPSESSGHNSSRSGISSTSTVPEEAFD